MICDVFCFDRHHQHCVLRANGAPSRKTRSCCERNNCTHTGLDRTIVDVIMAHIDWQGQLVDATVCGDEVTQGHPAPFLIFRAMERTGVTSVHNVMVVGNTMHDSRAIIQIIGVLSGAHSQE